MSELPQDAAAPAAPTAPGSRPSVALTAGALDGLARCEAPVREAPPIRET